MLFLLIARHSEKLTNEKCHIEEQYPHLLIVCFENGVFHIYEKFICLPGYPSNQDLL